MKKLGLGLLVLVLVLSPFASKLLRGEQGKTVQAEAARSRAIATSILASGTLVYDQQAQLSPEVLGKVAAIHVKEGDVVSAGQVLLQLEEKSYQAEVAQQQAAVRQQRLSIEQQKIAVINQEQQLARKKALFEKGYVTRPQLDDAEFGLEKARIDLKISRENMTQTEAVLRQSQERLAKTTIRAPIGGTVTSVDIKPGETAVASQYGGAGSNMLTIANTDTLMAEVNVDEADMSAIRVGSKVSMYVAAYSDVALSGTVVTVPMLPRKGGENGAPAQNLAKSYSLKVAVAKNADISLKPGMTFRAEIFSAESISTLAVPVQSVLTNNSETTESEGGERGRKAAEVQNFVVVSKNGVAEKRQVRTGISNDNFQQIVDGLKAGEVVVTGPYKVLRHIVDGDKLKAEVAPDMAGIAVSGTARAQ